MKKGQAKIVVDGFRKRVEKLHESIVAKCHPAIFELAQLWKESNQDLKSLGPNPPGELVKKIEDRMEEQLERIQQKYSGREQPAPNTFGAQIIFSEEALQNESDSQGIGEWIHFERHKVPLKQDVEKRLAKDYEASKRILRTASDVEMIRCEKGSIQPFKGNLEHWTMFETLWGFGIEKLTPEELTEFFESYCPCGVPHDPDALKKIRKRIRETLAQAAQRTPSTVRES